MKCRGYGHAPGHEFSALLGRRALPDPENPAGTSAYGRGERHGCIDEDGAGLERSLQLLEKFSLSVERDCQDANIGRRARCRVFVPPDFCLRADGCCDPGSGLLRPFRIARPDDHRFTRSGPAQREAEPGGSGAAQNGDRPAHANSACSACSLVTCSRGSLM